MTSADSLPALPPQQLVKTLLDHLGYDAEVDAADRGGHAVLNVRIADSRRLIGREGRALEDLQYLVNRMLGGREESTARVIVDIEGYRNRQETDLVAQAKQRADTVRQTGRPQPLEPMNAYDRWLIHQAFAEDPEVSTRSEETGGKYKRVILELRDSSAAA